MKIIINKCPHGFTISDKQREELFPDTPLAQIPRHDGRLVASFEAGDRRGDGGSSLQLVEIPDGSHYRIVNMDGYESLFFSESQIHSR
jgi:hypothetical protein